LSKVVASGSLNVNSVVFGSPRTGTAIVAAGGTTVKKLHRGDPLFGQNEPLSC
jgi:hypothetical protein